MKTNDLIALKDNTQGKLDNLHKIEGQLEHLKKDLKDQGYKSLKETENGMEKLAGELKKLEKLFKDCTGEIEELLNEIDE